MGEPIAREGDVAWVDLMTNAPERSAVFYEELFGWRFGSSAGGYRLARLGGRAVAGILPAEEGQPIEEWAVWLGVDDLDDAFERALRHGAAALMEPFAVRDQGRCALLLDPAGSCTGLWEAARHPGLEARGVPGSPAWFELHVGDAQIARDFYRDVFGLTAMQMGSGEDFHYWTMHHGQEREAAFGLFGSGERDAQGNSTGAWVVYFATDDAAECVRRAARLGADVRFGPEPSVYGRMATLCDPAGAAFNLLQPERNRPAAQPEEPEAVPEQGLSAGGQPEEPAAAQRTATGRAGDDPGAEQDGETGEKDPEPSGTAAAGPGADCQPEPGEETPDAEPSAPDSHERPEGPGADADFPEEEAGRASPPRERPDAVSSAEGEALQGESGDRDEDDPHGCAEGRDTADAGPKA